MKNTGRLPWIGYHCCSLILLVISCTRLPQTTLASGVFELELLDFQRLDQSYQASGKVAQTNETTTTGQHNQITSPPMRILICLKEAFTSQLDGLCTFGNASITLGSQQSLEHHTVLPITNTNAAIEESQSNTKTTTAALAYQQVAASEAQRNDQQQQNATTSVVRRLLTNDQQEQQQRRGSLLTNAVRIQFTFRWTVSNSSFSPSLSLFTLDLCAIVFWEVEKCNFLGKELSLFSLSEYSVSNFLPRILLSMRTRIMSHKRCIANKPARFLWSVALLLCAWSNGIFLRHLHSQPIYWPKLCLQHGYFPLFQKFVAQPLNL